MDISLAREGAAHSIAVGITQGTATKCIEKDGVEGLSIGYGEALLNRRKLVVFARKIVATAKAQKLKNIS
ncbi:MAG TPA: hypothetical protein VN701_02565, partial [Candidatus Paceibacterota bacterium]|nr:hypothetical protein [Candidatus Paceibacterota bacterium]